MTKPIHKLSYDEITALQKDARREDLYFNLLPIETALEHLQDLQDYPLVAEADTIKPGLQKAIQVAISALEHVKDAINIVPSFVDCDDSPFRRLAVGESFILRREDAREADIQVDDLALRLEVKLRRKFNIVDTAIGTRVKRVF